MLRASIKEMKAEIDGLAKAIKESPSILPMPRHPHELAEILKGSSPSAFFNRILSPMEVVLFIQTLLKTKLPRDLKGQCLIEALARLDWENKRVMQLRSTICRAITKYFCKDQDDFWAMNVSMIIRGISTSQ